MRGDTPTPRISEVGITSRGGVGDKHAAVCLSPTRPSAIRFVRTLPSALPTTWRSATRCATNVPELRATPTAAASWPEVERKSATCARHALLLESFFLTCEPPIPHNSGFSFPASPPIPHYAGFSFPLWASALHRSAFSFPVGSRVLLQPDPPTCAGLGHGRAPPHVVSRREGEPPPARSCPVTPDIPSRLSS